MTQVLLKRSSTASHTPATTDLALGELAVNTYDGKLFLKQNNGADTILEVGAVHSVAGHTGVVTLSQADIGGLTTSSSPSFTQVNSTVSTGTPPFVVTSTTPVTNLSIGGNAATVTTNANLSGDVTSVGNTTTVTNAAVISKVLTGFVSGAGTVSSSDSLLQAIQKINGNCNLLTGAVVYQGTWNANTNTPTLTSGSGTKGYLYKVSVAGSTTIDGNSQWNVGDSIVFDGTAWDKIDGISSEVVSVAGRTGAVVLAVADVSGAAPLASPALTGVPTAPTATAGTNTTQLATTAFTTGAIATAVSVIDGGSF